MTKIIKLSKDDMSNIGIETLYPYMTWNPQYINFMNELPGREHYRMLASISKQLDDGAGVADVGTYFGASALAFSINPNVHVTTYDIHQCIPEHGMTPLARANVKQKVMSGQLDVGNIVNSDVVLLDIDPHDGPTETKFVELLMENNFQGILLCDDIFHNKGMTQFWNDIPSILKKVDVSEYGHWTGTGAVIFNPDIIDILLV